METRVAEVVIATVSGSVQGWAVASPSVLTPARRPFGPIVKLRREICCCCCGYGVVVAHPPSRCPMCDEGDWASWSDSAASASQSR